MGIARDAAYPGTSEGARRRSQAIAGWRAERWLAWLPLGGVTLLSFVLNAWSLSSAGYGNTYYAAAVRSMTLSWKNFFFGAFDPGGFITVDKPPFFLWVDALSARAFGYSSWSLLLPSAVAGAASVALLWLIVRRWFGAGAATVAGLVLALTPISVAVNRLNLPEPFMILLLVGAAGAVIQSIESRRWPLWLALAGALVGIGFNTKMLAAWIPGPAFALAVVAGTRVISGASLRNVLARLAVLGVATLIVSGSWLVVVDAWPASSRPYIGGSTNNTVLDLALGYNGFGRVDGNSQGGAGGPRPAAGRGAPRLGNIVTPSGRSAAAGGGGFAGPGGIFGGLPSSLRMLDATNGGQIGWLLPFALGAGAIALWYWRRDPVRRAVAILFLGWVLLYGAVFSYAQGIFHSYYTSAMAPGVAALAGIGSVALARAVRRDSRWLLAAAGLVAAGVWTELAIAGRTPEFYGWVRPLALIVAGAGLAAFCALALSRRPAFGGMALAIGGLLLLPAAWSVSAAANTSLNATLPQAGPQQGASGGTFGSAAFDDNTPALAAWLDAHRDPNATWQLVVQNSQNASRLIAEDNISVMSLGGFLGTDNTISVSGFADLVAAGKVRYVLAGGEGPGGRGRFGGPGRGGFGAFGAAPAPQFGGGTVPGVAGSFGRGGTDAATVMSAVQRACSPVQDRTLPAAYQGAIYDCAGQAAALRAAGG